MANTTKDTTHPWENGPVEEEGLSFEEECRITGWSDDDQSADDPEYSKEWGRSCLYQPDDKKP